MTASAIVLVFAALLLFVQGNTIPVEQCEAKARTTAGWVCGVRGQDINGGPFVSFKNVPYAKQPIGELRFKELQPPEPWEGLLDATQVGPICPQIDVLYGRLIDNMNMSEACIHANIFVPLYALPTNNRSSCGKKSPGLSVFVFFHGGGFTSGSGDPDLQGPEYLMPENVVLFTFNYRLGAFGYLSLETPSIPGNNGLRDALTFLRWVKENAMYFGGNPEDVTIGGQSSGGSNAHFMVLSKAAEGLFKRAILMSGVAPRSFFSTSPKFAKAVAHSFISNLGLNETDPEIIHQQLISIPLDEILNATVQLSADFTPITFCPVVEKYFPGVTTIIGKDPETLLLRGQGSNIPLLVGFTNLEEEFFIPNAIRFNTTERVITDPLLILSPDLVYKLPNETAHSFANETVDRYFNGEPTPEKYAKAVIDYGILYPAIKLVERRAAMGGAKAFLYQFSYNADFSAIKETKNIEYNGATHIDDLTFVFRTNSMKGIEKFDHQTRRDIRMRKYMVRVVKNFMTCNNPTCDITGYSQIWPAQKSGIPVKYENIVEPDNKTYSDLTDYQRDMVKYYDGFYDAVNE